jgi:hypothetical protein
MAASLVNWPMSPQEICIAIDGITQPPCVERYVNRALLQ